MKPKLKECHHWNVKSLRGAIDDIINFPIFSNSKVLRKENQYLKKKFMFGFIMKNKKENQI